MMSQLETMVWTPSVISCCRDSAISCFIVFHFPVSFPCFISVFWLVCRCIILASGWSHCWCPPFPRPALSRGRGELGGPNQGSASDSTQVRVGWAAYALSRCNVHTTLEPNFTEWMLQACLNMYTVGIGMVSMGPIKWITLSLKCTIIRCPLDWSFLWESCTKQWGIIVIRGV